MGSIAPVQGTVLRKHGESLSHIQLPTHSYKLTGCSSYKINFGITIILVLQVESFVYEIIYSCDLTSISKRCKM